jgi:hypothetical protein
MSALSSKPDIFAGVRDVALVPITDISVRVVWVTGKRSKICHHDFAMVYCTGDYPMMLPKVPCGW